ncbi:MAG: tRNA (adenosine(37)-N6)-threonylcarbamoyltransferase complex dimerization subunit type 1 TsaB [Acidobacteriota bacterium]|nr:tRNA (adenosine(37)-N6)-threonylcarbamoyltransferase complex dimerization subunit type 1 TsaB [Acidobacteriota bacterium]
MFILALDTSTRGGSVAVTRDAELLALVPGDATRSHSERLPGEIEAALDQAGLQRGDIGLLAVATGPGAFTGLRIGLAVMQGLAMTLNRAVIGISALDALAAEVEGADLVAPWMDAQRGEVFAMLLDPTTGRTLESPLAGDPAAVLLAWRVHLEGRAAVFIGDATSRDAALIAAAGAGQWTTRTPPPLAPALARLAGMRAARGEAGLPHQLTPIYVRRPDVEIERERREQP